jgi:hypothetical protein
VKKKSYILPESLHNVSFGQDLFPVTCVCGIRHHKPEGNVLAAVKGNVGYRGTLNSFQQNKNKQRRSFYLPSPTLSEESLYEEKG